MGFTSFGILGGGAWGTALAHAMRLQGRTTLLWAREAEVRAEINARHCNTPFLPGVALHPELEATDDLARIAAQDVVLMVAPAQFVRASAGALAALLPPGKPVVICAKGIEQGTGKLLGEVLAETLPQATVAVLSGPSFAADVARGLPAALTLATAEEALGEALATAIGGKQLRIYWTSDRIGVQLGGAVKNVLAIAAGLVAGRELGASAHAALVTRGFAELRRFAAAMGARPETLMGLSGLGDLLLTCGSTQSRNMSLGRALGRGETLASVLGARRSVTEGVYTAAALALMAAGAGAEMPICRAVHDIVEGRLEIAAAISGLLSRPFRAEA